MTDDDSIFAKKFKSSSEIIRKNTFTFHKEPNT